MWVKAMFLGLMIHVPAAVLTWHLVSRYSFLLYVQADLEERTIVGGPVLGKPVTPRPVTLL